MVLVLVVLPPGEKESRCSGPSDPINVHTTRWYVPGEKLFRDMKTRLNAPPVQRHCALTDTENEGCERPGRSVLISTSDACTETELVMMAAEEEKSLPPPTTLHGS
jgi:hypothetical protein